MNVVLLKRGTVSIDLTDVYDHADRSNILYRLLSERDESINISHQSMPSMEDHIRFVESRPYRKWLFIRNGDAVIGACYLTNNNEIGIFVFREFQGTGYGKAALKLLLDTYEPLPAIRSVRPGNFVANIKPSNKRSIALFEGVGAKLRQLTYDVKK